MSTQTPLSTTSPSATGLSSTERTALHRHKERGRTDREDLYAVLDAGLICHLGVIIDGVPGRAADRVRPRGRPAVPARLVR